MKRKSSFISILAIVALSVGIVASFPGRTLSDETDFTKLGNKVVCPVMDKHIFTIAKDTPKYSYRGKTYFLYCSGCLQRFKKNPGKYVGMASEAATH